jgi:hypothetical protein
MRGLGRGRRRRARADLKAAIRPLGVTAGLAYGREGEAEAVVSAENWHEERDRLVRLLKAIESGEVTHVDEEDLRQLQATTPENIEVLKQRLAELNDRLSRG